MSNVHSVKIVLQHRMYMHVVGARFYNMIVQILLILKIIVFITSKLSRLVAVPVHGYVHTHTIQLYHICIYVCDY